MAWKRDANGWAVRRHEWMPGWLRITVRLIVMLPLWPLWLCGRLADRLFDLVDPYLPRGM